MDREIAERGREEFSRHHPVGQDDARVPGFYEQLGALFDFNKLKTQKKLVFVVAAHMVHTLPHLLEMLTQLGTVVAIIPKASRYVPEVVVSLNRIYERFIRRDVNKGTLQGNAKHTTAFLREIAVQWTDHKIVIVDHGGYFAPRLHDSLHELQDKIALVVEHTANGDDRYAEELKKAPSPVPLASIARSPFKHYENTYVTRSIVDAMFAEVFSGKGLNQALERLNIGVIGYGNMGEGVARALRIRAESVSQFYICDRDEATCRRARLYFLHVSRDNQALLQNADVIVCAASAKVLAAEDFQEMKPGCCIVFVTSMDDQVAPNALEDAGFEVQAGPSGSAVTAYKHKSSRKIIYLAANGCSLNFSLGSTSHPVLAGVFANVAACIVREVHAPHLAPYAEICSVSDGDTAAIEALYERHFGPIRRQAETFGLQKLNCHFVGRAKELEQLRSVLARGEMGVLTQAVAGLGGIGKTTLAEKYAEEAIERGDYDYVLRLNALTPSALYQEFIRLATTLGIAEAQKIPPKVLVTLVYQQLQRHHRVLIIFDDAENHGNLTKAQIGLEEVNFLSPVVSGQLMHCIVTTRNQHFVSGEVITLNGWSSEEALEYIQFHLMGVSDEDAEELARLLRYFPLALCQAVAYLKEHPELSVLDYGKLYGEKQREFLSSKALPEDPYLSTIYTTWNISFEALARRNSLSVRILNLTAHFGEAPILVELFAKLGGDTHRALEQLEKYSFVRRDEKNKMFGVHQLVQTVSRLQQKDKNIFRIHLSEALQLVHAYVCDAPDISQSIVHAEAVVTAHEENLPTEDCSRKVHLLLKVGSHQHFHLLFSAAAVKTYQWANAIRKRAKLSQYLLETMIGLANSSSGAANPLDYVAMLDELMTADDLKVEDILTIAGRYGINVNLEEAKKELLRLPEIQPFVVLLAQMPAVGFFQFFLSAPFKSLRQQYAPQILASIGALQLAIVYLIYKGDFQQAEHFAEIYKAQEEHTPSSQVEAACLYVETKAMRGVIDLAEGIDLLEEASGILISVPEIDQYWNDQIQFMRSILYAVRGDFAKSHATIFALWETMVSQVPPSAADESIKARIKSLARLILEFFEKKLTPPAFPFFAQAVRILGRLFAALKEPVLAEECFKKSLQYDESCLVTHYELGCLLARDARRHQEATECFHTVIVLIESMDEDAPLEMHPHFVREALALPKCMRSLVTSEAQNSPLSLKKLACAFLAFVSYKQGNYQASREWLSHLDPAQVSASERTTISTIFHRLKTKLDAVTQGAASAASSSVVYAP